MFGAIPFALTEVNCNLLPFLGQGRQWRHGEGDAPDADLPLGFATLINHGIRISEGVSGRIEGVRPLPHSRKTIQFPQTMYRYPASMPLSARSAVPAPGTAANSCAFSIAESTRRIAAYIP